MKYSVDRIEESRIVLEDENRSRFSVDIKEFKKKPREGDIVTLSDGEFSVDGESTEALRREINELLEKLINKKKH